MLSSAYFILSLTDNEYRSIRKKRILSLARDKDMPLNDDGAVVLVYNNETNMVLAEYEIDEFELDNHMVKLHFEPIYNAPTGVKLTDLVLLTLTSKTLEEWRKNLKSHFIRINEDDFNELLTRLKG